MRLRLCGILAATAGGLLGGCAGGGRAAQGGDAATASRPGEIVVWPGQYEAAFDAARRTLRDYNFILERVDAQAGVITTAPKGSGGLATPWDREQQSFVQETEDFAQRQRRRVRVVFLPTAPGVEPPADARGYEGEMTMRIEAVIDRVHQPGWRLNSNDVLSSTYTYDPVLAARVRGFPYSVATAQDQNLAERLASKVSERMMAAGSSLSEPRAPAAPAPAGG